MTKFWRLQNLSEIQLEPSWDSHAMAEPSEPADEDGWDGYWWAYKYAPSISGSFRPDYSLAFLISAEGVAKARDGEAVDTFVPGVFGCKDASAMLAYIEQAGAVDDDQFVCLYNGYGDTIVVAEIERGGRKDYLPAENWQELQDAARAYLASRGVRFPRRASSTAPNSSPKSAVRL
jgi:hypothetical protein